MGTYRRSGHWRRGKNGTRHWVSAHSVTRSGSSWSAPPRRATRTAPPGRSTRTPLPKGSSRPKTPKPPRSPRARQPYSSRWATPNAVCPVCGAAVYFYSNEHGSRVYFDEMGPPWPKHPCMNSIPPTGPFRVASSRQGPALRTFRDGRRKAASADLFAGTRGASEYAQRFGLSPATAWVVLETWPVSNGTMLHLHRAYGHGGPEAWFTPAQIQLPRGLMAFMRSDELSYLDPASVEVASIEVRFSHLLPKPALFARVRAHLRGRPIL